MEVVLYLLFFAILLLFLRWVRQTQSKKQKLPPSPLKLPIIGNLHQLGALPHRNLGALSNKHGPLMLLHLASIQTLVVSSSKFAQEILKTHDVTFSSRPISNIAHKLLYGCTDITFSHYGEYWRKVKRICMLELLSTKRVLSFRRVREEEVANMMETIRKSSMTTVDLTEMMLNLAGNITSRVALGKKYEGDGDNGKNQFGKMATELNSLLGCFSVGDYFPSLAWIDFITGMDARIERNACGFDAFLDQVIKDHLGRRVQTDGGDERMGGDFVDQLLRMQMDCSLDIPFTKDHVKAIILDMLVGGTDSITVTMEWAMAELIRCPKVMKKAQEEVRRIAGRKSKVEEEDLHQMNYIKCIIKETLRLHPVAPLLVPHESITSSSIHGYHIPTKTRVLVNAWAIGRDPNSWENAEEFLPERFIDNPIDYKSQDFQFIPFGAGRRGCPGLGFAIVILELTIANLLYWSDWELPGDSRKEDLDMSEASGMAVRKKSPLLLVPIQYFS